MHGQWRPAYLFRTHPLAPVLHSQGFVPFRYQILVANVVGLGWAVFLSSVINPGSAPPPSDGSPTDSAARARKQERGDAEIESQLVKASSLPLQVRYTPVSGGTRHRQQLPPYAGYRLLSPMGLTLQQPLPADRELPRAYAPQSQEGWTRPGEPVPQPCGDYRRPGEASTIGPNSGPIQTLGGPFEVLKSELRRPQQQQAIRRAAHGQAVAGTSGAGGVGRSTTATGGGPARGVHV